MPDEKEKETVTFEQDLRRLDEIVRELEDGGLPLDKSLSLFEEGQKLLTRCRKKLDEASVTVRRLLENGDTEEIDPLSLGR